jgi:hypothetical protein
VAGKDSVEIEYYCPIKMDRLFTKVLEKTRREDVFPEKNHVVGPLAIIESVEQLL